LGVAWIENVKTSVFPFSFQENPAFQSFAISDKSREPKLEANFERGDSSVGPLNMAGVI
jgi:hypothetical protein